MKKLIVLLFFIAIGISYGQTGSVAGKILDKEMNNEPLPFASVIIKGTTKGTTTDFDGLFEIGNLQPGNYTVVISYVGYETLEIENVIVETGKVANVNATLAASSVSLEEVTVVTVARKDSETALLLDQKKAVEIKESIGAQALTKLGVSDAATATTKISGVTSSEGSGDVFVRGLGDRYLITTMNGLPVPSDDVERKNIDLGLFPTRIIQNVSISKTYAVKSSADEASGAVDITTRELAGSEEYSIGVNTGINTNVARNEVYDNFKVSPNTNNTQFGFYSQELNTFDAITQQTWNTQQLQAPVNYGINATLGKKFGEKLAVILTASQNTKHEHTKGVFRQFRSNFIDDSIPDVETFAKKITTTVLADATFFANEKNKLKATSLFVNKLTDQVFEGGRGMQATIFEETEPAEGLFQFIRDQNVIQTRLWVAQLSGKHTITDKYSINWAGGYNFVDASEPNRIRNEINFNEDLIQLGRTGGFQQRKSKQTIEDEEFNGLLNNELSLVDKENHSVAVSFGANYRNKERKFGSQFIGVEEAFTNAINPSSIDNLSAIFTTQNFEDGVLKYNILQPDRYLGELKSVGTYANVAITLNKFNINAGLRYQVDDIYVLYDVGNIPGRIGESDKSYDNIYPSFNIKYNINEQHALRFATSQTITLPEFKEIAPFEYVSPTGQVTRGNPNLQASTNFNYDLKWEYFPSNAELISIAAFYKTIEDPINKVQDRGSAGVFSFFNSGDKATVYGLELETRIGIIKPKDNESSELNLNFNATRMWHEQDLKEVFDENGNFVRTFRYKGLTETGLQGASDWIVNTSLNFATNGDNPLDATLTANYASDKIFALGAPEIQSASEQFYNDAIIEKGFVTLDAVVSKRINNLTIRLTGKNLLNPTIKRTQLNKPSTTNIEAEETVRSYTNGVQIGLGFSYNFK